MWLLAASGLPVSSELLSSSVAEAATTITEFPIPTSSSSPNDIAAGPDGDLWFTEGAAKIARITPSGVISELATLTAGSFPEGIAAGPDGNLWFAASNANKIGKITLGGAVTEYPVPSGGFPPDIASGPDGNLWFTEAQANNIGRITPAGVITEYPIPTGASAPFGIAAGPDGNVWFTEAAGNKIGRITSNGVISEYPILSNPGNPDYIIAGPDGNLWFTEIAGNKIGKITPSGAITDYPIPTSRSDPYDIAAGSDGNLWFTESANHSIARITPGGLITEFPIPFTGTLPWAIAAGPDGNVWFTDLGTNSIGQMIISPATQGPLDHFAVAPSTTTTLSGAAFIVSVTAVDINSNQVSNYTGTIAFSSSDTAAALPANYTFSAADGGSHMFGVTLTTVGPQTVSVNDIVQTKAVGVSQTITVRSPGCGGAPTVTDVRAIGPLGKELDPAGGPIGGGTTVTIKGCNFTPASTVTFGGDQATHVTFQNSHTLIAVSPPKSFYFPPVDGTFHDASDVYVQVSSGCCDESAPTASSRFFYFIPQIGTLINTDGFSVCAATVVSSAGQATSNTILTAGHCVAGGGTGQFFSDFAFAPGYYGPLCSTNIKTPADRLKCGAAPYGVWTVSRVGASSGWLANTHHGDDFGFLDLKPKHGASISSVVGGGLVITFNAGGDIGGAANQSWTLYGDNLGNVPPPTAALKQCGSAQAIDFSPGDGGPDQLKVELPSCVMRMFPGNSGGPWINPVNGDGRGIGAVNSTNQSGFVSGTYLGDDARAVFTGM
jgi:streptogramin lyase